MARQIQEVVFLKADADMQQMTPATVRTLSYSVRFPDGDSLYKKWKDNIEGRVIPIAEDIVVKDGSDVYTWRTINYSEKIFMLNGRFYHSAPNNGERRNIFKMKLPVDRIKDIGTKNPIINVTPGNQSTYYSLAVIFTTTAYIEGDYLCICVDSANNIPNTYPLIYGDFSVSITIHNI